MFFEVYKDEFVLLRVRLNPSSSSCCFQGFWVDANNEKFVKISVNAVPEKGKANKELISFLAKNLKIAKSCFED